MNRQVRLAHQRDQWRWLTTFLLLVAGAIANMYFENMLAWPFITLGWIVLMILMGFLVLRTRKGHAAWEFFKEAKHEVKRVVWPTRKETTQMTMLVMLMAVVVALILWGLDSLLLVAIRWFTGLGG